MQIFIDQFAKYFVLHYIQFYLITKDHGNMIILYLVRCSRGLNLRTKINYLNKLKLTNMQKCKNVIKTLLSFIEIVNNR